ncbi:MAG: tetratricopeptide repeat protein, partial [Pseudomonadota bacterium]
MCADQPSNKQNIFKGKHFFDSGEQEQRKGNHLRAISFFNQAILENPTQCEYHRCLAISLRALGKTTQAITAFETAIRLQPNSALTYTCLGNALTGVGRFEEAKTAHQHALQLQPDFAEAWSNLGLTYRTQDKLAEAIDCFSRATQLKGNIPDLFHNLGSAFLLFGKLEQAKIHLGKTLELDPRHVRALVDLSTVFKERGDLEQAVSLLQQALVLDPNSADAHWNLGLMLLSQGKFEQGWAEYEWRRKIPDIKIRSFAKPFWDGKPLGDKTLLLHAEQGIGDSIQFIRYAKMIQKEAGRVVFDCPSKLVRLLGNSLGIDEIIAQGTSLPKFDCHAPLLSLPFLFGTKEGTIPSQIPYLEAEKSLVQKWSKKFADKTKLNIGIGWQGNPKYRADNRRSMPLQSFASLAHLNGVRLFCLQKGPGQEQVSALSNPFKIEDLSPFLDTGPDAFVDTAAAIQNLDLIICSDTALPHLAGALGAETWMLLCALPDWRWGTQSVDCPWYPTMKIFRQK